jgi:hypothetical protein
MSATYSGNILDIRTFDAAGVQKASFKSGEKVKMQVFYQTSIDESLWTMLGNLAWHAAVEVYDDKGVKLANETTSFVAPISGHATMPAAPWDKPMTVYFNMPPRGFTGKVRLIAGG